MTSEGKEGGTPIAMLAHVQSRPGVRPVGLGTPFFDVAGARVARVRAATPHIELYRIPDPLPIGGNA